MLIAGVTEPLMRTAGPVQEGTVVMFDIVTLPSATMAFTPFVLIAIAIPEPDPAAALQLEKIKSPMIDRALIPPMLTPFPVALVVVPVNVILPEVAGPHVPLYIREIPCEAPPTAVEFPVMEIFPVVLVMKFAV
jgi:hypothetical protein